MKTILIIDDDFRLRNLLNLSLERMGFAVLQASNGKEALKLLEAQSLQIDLIITDLLMPEMDGFETILQIKKLKTGIKIIAISGGARLRAADILPIAKQLGASLTLNKPFTYEELQATISETLNS